MVPRPSTIESGGSAPLRAQFGFLAGVAQLVERQPSKLNVVGSNPISRSLGSSRLLNAGAGCSMQTVVQRRLVNSYNLPS